MWMTARALTRRMNLRMWTMRRPLLWVVTRPTFVTGIFQHHPLYWEARTARAGISGASIFDPYAQATVAALLVTEDKNGNRWIPHFHCATILEGLGIWE